MKYLKINLLFYPTLSFALYLSLSAQALLAEEPVKASSKNAKTKQMVGWVEKVKIKPENLLMHAKLVPGTETSSINAANIKLIEKKDKKVIQFDLTDRNGTKKTLRKVLSRVAKIKSKGGKPTERYTVELGLCVGNTYLEEEVTLANRENFEYELLIGRSFLAGNLTIDPSLSFTFEPTCEK